MDDIKDNLEESVSENKPEAHSAPAAEAPAAPAEDTATAEDDATAEDAAAAEEIPAADEEAAPPDDSGRKPKQKKALRITLIVLALLLLLLVIGGVAVVKMLGNLGNIKPTDGGNGTASVSETASSEDSSAEAEDTTADTDGSQGTSEESTTTVENETADQTSAAADEGEEPATADTTDGSSGETTTADQTDHTTKVSPQNTTAADGSASQTTTAPSGRQETTTEAPKPEKSEYDIYRSGHFHMTGFVTDSEGTSPMELAVTDDSVYMTSELDGVRLGMLVSGKKTYLIYPEKKAYMELNSMVMGMIGADAEELFNTDDMGFNRLLPLDKAISHSTETVNGTVCQKYLLPDGDNFYYVYINGAKLVRIQALDSSKNLESTIDFTSVSGNVPADRTAPSPDYAKTGMFEFIGMLSEVIE